MPFASLKFVLNALQGLPFVKTTLPKECLFTKFGKNSLFSHCVISFLNTIWSKNSTNVIIAKSSIFWDRFFQHGLTFLADQQFFKGYVHAHTKTQPEDSTEAEKSACRKLAFIITDKLRSFQLILWTVRERKYGSAVQTTSDQ